MTTKKKTPEVQEPAPKDKKPTQPRGLRNCNPLNIIRKDSWIGLADKQTDPKFCQFTDMKYGYRAALVLLRRYINGYHLNTVSSIVARWAPDGSQAVADYVAIVCRHMGVHPHVPISFGNRGQMTLLLEGMTIAENGKLADASAIEDAFAILLIDCFS